MFKITKNVSVISLTAILNLTIATVQADYYQNQNPNFQNQNYQNQTFRNQNQNYQNPNFQNQNFQNQNPNYQSENPSYQNQNPSYYQNQNPYSYQPRVNTYSSYYAEASANTGFKNNETVPDQELTNKIREKLSSGMFSKGYGQVSAQVNNGVVTLQGFVNTFSDKEKVEKEIRNLTGVRGLTSDIQVRDPSSKESPRRFAQDTYATTGDDQLNKKIRDNVSNGWLWDSYTEVTLNTTNGVVTLEGMVASIGDQQKLATEIQKIDGVKSVKSNLKIKNSQQ